VRRNQPEAWWHKRFARNRFRVLDERVLFGQFTEHRIGAGQV
jgi:hypothetical protein